MLQNSRFRTALLGQELRDARRIRCGRANHSCPADARLFAIHAIEHALLDLLARQVGLPLVDLLGGPSPNTWRSMRISIAASPIEVLVVCAAGARGHQAGFTAIKVAPFDRLDWSSTLAESGRELVEAGIERILAVREAVGPSPLLFVDCHWRLTPLMALDVLKETDCARFIGSRIRSKTTHFEAEDARRSAVSPTIVV